MSRADIHSHNSIFMKLLKYYLTSGTVENQTLAIVIQILFFFKYLNSCVERKHLTKRSS